MVMPLHAHSEGTSLNAGRNQTKRNVDSKTLIKYHSSWLIIDFVYVHLEDDINIFWLNC